MMDVIYTPDIASSTLAPLAPPAPGSLLWPIIVTPDRLSASSTLAPFEDPSVPRTPMPTRPPPVPFPPLTLRPSPRYNVFEVADFFKDSQPSFRRAELRFYHNRDGSLYMCLSIVRVVDEVIELQGLRVDVHLSVMKAMPQHLAGAKHVLEAAMKREWAESRELVTSGRHDNCTAMFDCQFAPCSGPDLVMLTLLSEAPLHRNLLCCCERAFFAAIAAGANAALRGCCREKFHLSVKPTWIPGDGFWLLDA